MSRLEFVQFSDLNNMISPPWPDDQTEFNFSEM